MVHLQIVRSIRIDGDVAGDGHALLVDRRPQVEVVDKVGDVDAYLSKLRSQGRSRRRHLRRNVSEHLALVVNFGVLGLRPYRQLRKGPCEGDTFSFGEIVTFSMAFRVIKASLNGAKAFFHTIFDNFEKCLVYIARSCFMFYVSCCFGGIQSP